MLFALASVLIALVIIDRSTRVARLDLLVLSIRHRLFSLRDRLRQAAIQGNVKSGSWLFDYLDTSLTRSAHHLRDLSLFELAYLGAKADDQENFRALRRSLHIQLNQQENSHFRSVFEDFQGCLLQFLKERHRTLFYAVRVVVRTARSGQRLKKKWNGFLATGAMVCDPKTSTLPIYGHP